jgi:hypothetical protein
MVRVEAPVVFSKGFLIEKAPVVFSTLNPVVALQTRNSVSWLSRLSQQDCTRFLVRREDVRRGEQLFNFTQQRGGLLDWDSMLQQMLDDLLL